MRNEAAGSTCHQMDSSSSWITSLFTIAMTRLLDLCYNYAIITLDFCITTKIQNSYSSGQVLLRLAQPKGHAFALIWVHTATKWLAGR